MEKDKPATQIVSIIGSGTMGAGIAQVAASFGHEVVLLDSNGEALSRARVGINKALRRDVEKGRITEDASREIERRINFVDATLFDASSAFGSSSMVIEAIVEDLSIKQQTFKRIENFVSPDCILATNTSSLSVASIASMCARPERVLGIHFFNPAQLMPLVEIIPGMATDRKYVDCSCELISGWKKTVVLAKDTPGFVVNRLARPFYGEALRILEESIADVATIDWAMTELGGFKMGPFTLMDMIGNDVNYRVTEIVFEALYYDPRYRPSITQKRMVEANLLGRKVSRGFYDYREGAPKPEPTRDAALGKRIVDRIVAMLINEACEARLLNIATSADLDLAMTKGVNYPKGLLAMGTEIGPAVVLARLDELQAEYGEDRYRASPWLRRAVRENKGLA